MLGNRIFTHFFSSWHFLTVSTPTFFCIGLYLCYRRKSILDNARFLLLNFFKTLLPLFALIAWLFFIVLSIKASRGLNEHGLLTPTAMSNQCWYLTVLGILFINAVYQDGADAAQLNKTFRWVMNALIV
jgi:hypothetical protein